MKNLILIHGASQQTVETALCEMAKNINILNGDEDSGITSLKLYATRDATTFALRPNRLCGEWDFIGLCYHLIDAFEKVKEAHLEAWFRPETDSTGNLPNNKMLYIVFGVPKHNDYCLVDKKGNRYLLADATDEESGADCLQVVQSGTATYKPYPKLQLIEIPNKQGHFEVGKPSRRKKLSNLWDWMLCHNLITLISILIFSSIAILSVCAVWDFRETLLPFSLPRWGIYAVPATAGAVWAILMAIRKKYDLWGSFILGTILSALAIGLIMALVFSVNQWFESSDEIRGSGIVTNVESSGGNDPNYNYHVDVASPTEGKLFIRMHNEGSFSPGDSVTIVLHRGLYGMLHAEKIEHK